MWTRCSRPWNGSPRPFNAHSTPVRRPYHVHKVDISPAIHICHTHGIGQDRQLHANTTPTIFNWVIRNIDNFKKLILINLNWKLILSKAIYFESKKGSRGHHRITGATVVAPAEKASLLGSQFDSKQCRE